MKKDALAGDEGGLKNNGDGGWAFIGRAELRL